MIPICPPFYGLKTYVAPKPVVSDFHDRRSQIPMPLATPSPGHHDVAGTQRFLASLQNALNTLTLSVE